MTFNSDTLLNELDTLTADVVPARWIVAFSGGIDSTVLLHALAKSNSATNITAVHINHGLQVESDAWVAHCQRIAAELDVEFLVQNVCVKEGGAGGPEAAARTARYAAFHALLERDDCLLSAHNQDDQGETLLLNLMRGSGPAGLAGIGRRRAFATGLLLRPLLSVSREQIEFYAAESELRWLEDPSNSNTRFDRNFLRHEVISLLAERWPAVSSRLTRSAELQGEASELLLELADIDLEEVGSAGRLRISRLQHLSQPRQRNLLRRAVSLNGLPTPPATRLEQIINELIPARSDAQPLVCWAGAEVRRFRDEIFILPIDTQSAFDFQADLPASGDAICLGPTMGALELVPSDAAGIAPAIAEGGLKLRLRSGGEVLRVSGHGGTKKLKTLLQDQAILPWMRSRLPLLYSGDRLVAVANLWVAEDCLETPGYRVKWRDPPVLK